MCLHLHNRFCFLIHLEALQDEFTVTADVGGSRVWGGAHIHTCTGRKTALACWVFLKDFLPVLTSYFYLCTCSKQERDFLTWWIKCKTPATAEHPQKSLKCITPHKNPSSAHDSFWLSDRLQGLVPHAHLSCETIYLLNSTPPPVHLQKWFSPHLLTLPLSVILSRSLSLGFAPPTHTLCKCQSSETERERESRRLCLLRKLSAASSAGLLKQGVRVCVCAHRHTQSDLSGRERARRVLHWEKSAFEQEKNGERRTFCFYCTFFSLQLHVGSFFARKKERKRERVN